jgi:hypothetical protein
MAIHPVIDARPQCGNQVAYGRRRTQEWARFIIQPLDWKLVDGISAMSKPAACVAAADSANDR